MNYRRGAIARSAECLANRARSAVILKRDRKRACRAGDNAAIQRPNCDLAAHVGRNLNIVIRTRARARARERERERGRNRDRDEATCDEALGFGLVFRWASPGASIWLDNYRRETPKTREGHGPRYLRARSRPFSVVPSVEKASVRSRTPFVESTLQRCNVLLRVREGQFSPFLLVRSFPRGVQDGEQLTRGCDDNR